METFRPRRDQEDMASYLREKQAFELANTGSSTIDLGEMSVQPTFNTATAGQSAGVANNTMGNIPNGSIVKFDSGPEVYLVDNGTLRHFTKEVKDKSGRSIFVNMETIPTSYKANFTMGADISADIPFDPTTKGWASNLTATPPATTTPITPVTPINLNTTPLGLSGVNALFTQYYGRNATQEELDYWKNKSDAELRPKLIPNSETELARNKPVEQPAVPGATPGGLDTTPLGKSGVNALFKQYYGRDASMEELAYWKNKSDAELRPKLIPNSEIELARNKPVEKPKEVLTPEILKGGGNITEQQVRDAFKAFGFEPDTGGLTDIAYWSSKPNTDLTKLYDNLRTRQEKAIEDKKKADEEAKKAADEAAKLAEEQKKAEEAKKAEEDAAKQQSLQTIYGQTKQPANVEEWVGNFVGAALTSIVRTGGITQATFDKYVKNNPTQLAKYVNAMLYGGYDKVEYLYRDLKAKELADQGNTAYQNYKAFDETVNASEWFNTPEGQKVLNDATLAPSAGVINETLLNNSIFTIPNEAFSTLFEPIDINSPEFKAEAEKIQASYYDIKMEQATAETEQQKAVANENARLFTADLNKKYGISLSDDSRTAWGQLQSLFSGASQKGLGTSGLVGEAMDKYLADTRRRDQLLREEKITAQERDTLNNLLKNGSSEDIKKFVDADPARAEQLGLKPSAEVANWYSAANLKSLYPDMSDTDIANIRNSMIDPITGNYRSDLYQTLYLNNYGLGQQKIDYQQKKLEEQKLAEEQKAYAPYTTGNLLSSFPGYIPPATPGAPGAPGAPVTPPAEQTTKVNVKDKDGNTILVYPSDIPKLISDGVLPAGTVAPGTAATPTPTTPTSTPVTPTPAVPVAPATAQWTPPTEWGTDYQQISGPSQLPYYYNIKDQPETVNKWGVPKIKVPGTTELGLYKEADIERIGDKDIYLKPGVKKLW